MLIIPREGAVEVAGETIAPGACAMVASLSDVRYADNGICLIAMPLAGAL